MDKKNHFIPSKSLVKYWLSRGTYILSYTVWNKKPNIHFFDKFTHIMFLHSKDCKKLVPNMYGFDILFPKLYMKKGTVKEIEVEEIEDGYIVRSVKNEKSKT